jgi:hypothetical protein
MIGKWIGYIKAILAFLELLNGIFGSKAEAAAYLQRTTAKARKLDTDMARMKFEGLENTLG